MEYPKQTISHHFTTSIYPSFGETTKLTLVMLSNIVEVADDHRVRIVPVGPWQGLKTPLMKDQGQVRVDSLREIHAVRVVLPCSQDQPFQGDIPGIYVDPPPSFLKIPSFQLNGLKLNVNDRLRPDEILEREKSPVK